MVHPLNQRLFQKVWLCRLFTFRSFHLHLNFRKILWAILEEKSLPTDILTYWPTESSHFIGFLFSQRQGSKINFGTPTVFEIYMLQNSLWVCLGMPRHPHLKLHDQFSTLIYIKLHAQYQLSASINFWDNKVLKASLNMPRHAWQHPPKLTWSIYNFNRYEAVFTKSSLYL